MHRSKQSDRLNGGKVATVLARQFNVSPKAVRDIWNRRTWVPETRHLWTKGETAMVRAKVTRSKLDDKDPSTCSIHHHWPPVSGTSSRASRQLQHGSNQPAFFVQGLMQGSTPAFCDQCQWIESPTPAIEMQTDSSTVIMSPLAFNAEHLPNRAQEQQQLQQATTPNARGPVMECRHTGGLVEGAADGWLNCVAADDPFHADWPYW